MKKKPLLSKLTKTAKPLTKKQIQAVVGGDCGCPTEPGKDSIDVNSELASGGTTTDTYE